VVGGKSSLVSKIQSQMASLVALAKATYLASIKEVTTVVCFLKD